MMNLSPNSRAILRAIADGRTYEQILAIHPQLTYKVIFNAAAEALALLDSGEQGAQPKSHEERLAEIKEAHPRAYEAWCAEEDADLARFFNSGMSPSEIAKKLQRQPSAIRSRLSKLNLVS